MREVFYRISRTELLELLEAEAQLSCLEHDGVDNWMGYMEGREEFIAARLAIPIEEVKNNNIDFAEVAELEIEDYDEI